MTTPDEAMMRAAHGERGVVDDDGATWHPNGPGPAWRPIHCSWWRRFLDFLGSDRP